MTTTQSNQPNVNGTVESADQVDLAELLTALLPQATSSAAGKASASQSPEHHTSQRSAVQLSPRSVLRTANSAPDIGDLASQLHRSAKGQNGLVGNIKSKLFGHPLERQQVEDLRRRIGALTEAERTQLAISLVGAIRKAGLVVITDTISAEFDHVSQFPDGHPSRDLGDYVLDRDKTYLADIEDRINQSGESRVLKEIGFDR